MEQLGEPNRIKIGRIFSNEYDATKFVLTLLIKIYIDGLTQCNVQKVIGTFQQPKFIIQGDGKAKL